MWTKSRGWNTLSNLQNADIPGPISLCREATVFAFLECGAKFSKGTLSRDMTFHVAVSYKVFLMISFVLLPI